MISNIPIYSDVSVINEPYTLSESLNLTVNMKPMETNQGRLPNIPIYLDVTVINEPYTLKESLNLTVNKKPMKTNQGR